MASTAGTLKGEEQRRRVTILLLLTGMVVLAFFATQERAMFRQPDPFSFSGDMKPKAYGFVIRDNLRSYPKRIYNRPAIVAEEAGPSAPADTRPVAYSVRIPAEPATESPAVENSVAEPAGALRPDAVAITDPGNPTDTIGPNPDPFQTPDSFLNVPPTVVSPIPEPATWLSLIMGFALTGAMLRFARLRKSLPHQL